MHAHTRICRSIVRILARSCAIAAVLALVAPAANAGARLLAQGCSIDPPCPGNQKPHIVISPAGGMITASPVTVTVYISDDAALNADSLTTDPSITLTGTFTPGNTSATLTGTLSLSGSGAHTFTVRLADREGLADTVTATYDYEPPPPPPAQDSARLSLAPYSNSVRHLVGCSGCLYGTATYTTPAYVSRDAPRSISLVYSSAEAAPVGLVQVDATIRDSTPPDHISMRLLHGGSAVALSNGSTVAYYTGDTGTVRLAAQFDASSLANGFYSYVAEVTTWWGGASYVNSIPVRVLIESRHLSTTGSGWNVAGLQRLWNTAGDSVAITDGSGNIAFFPRSGSTTFARPDGDFTTLTVSSGVYTRTSVDGSFARFNSAGFLTATGNRFGDSTTYVYDGANRISTITDEAGKTTTFTYAPDTSCLAGAETSELCAITTPGGRKTKVLINSSNDVVQIIDPDGVTAFTGTYSSHRLVSATDRLNAQTNLVYDAFGGLDSLTGPSVTTTTPGGSTTSEASTMTFRSIEAALLATGDTTPGTARSYVLADSAFAQATAPNGTVTKMILQGAGEPTTAIVHPVSGVDQMSVTAYNSDFMPLSVVVTPLGGTTLYSWSADELLNTTDASGVFTEFSYESTHHQPANTWINGSLQTVNRYSSDAADTLMSSVSGQDSTVYHWDAHGRLTGTDDRAGNSTAATYESSGFQNTHTQAVGSSTTTFLHDQFGRDSVVTDAVGNSTVFLYDVLNRPVTLTQPGSVSTSTSYTENTTSHTLTTAITDPRSLTFTTVTNAVGWPTAVTDPQSNTSTAGYDRNGFVRRAVNRASEVATFYYDSLGRDTLRIAGGDTTRFAYDTATSLASAHRMVLARGGNVDTVQTDAQGRVAALISVRNGVTYTATTSYDAAGNRSVLALAKAGGWVDTLTFVNDSVQFPAQLPDFGGNWTTVRYNNEQLLDTLRFPTGSSTTRLKQHFANYTAFGRPSEIDVYVGSALQGSWHYTFDNLGRDTAEDAGSDRDYTHRLFTYDARGRLSGYSDHHIYADSVQESCPDNQITCDPPPPWDLTWHDDVIQSATYSPDHSGNRTDGSASLSNDRLSSMTGADGRSYSFSYDAEGRVTAKTASGYSQTYGWNDLNELVWVKTNGDSVAFEYDASGHRVRKYESSTGATTRYLWDGDNLAVQLDASGNVVYAFSYQGALDQPLAVKSSAGAMSYYQLDLQGNVIGIWNTSNTQVATYAYDPFGYGQTVSGSFSNQPLRWKGAYYDAETGLYYMRARYYDPTVGRFVSEDPAGVSAGINPYTFADGEPVNNTDPTGKMECPAGYVSATVKNSETGEETEGCAQDMKGMVSTDQAPSWWQSELFMLEHMPEITSGFHQQVLLGAVPSWVGGPGSAGAAEHVLDELRLTKTVASHAASRPYVNSRMLVDEIMRAGAPVGDPQGVAGALRWDVPGAFNGDNGVWQLVVDTKTSTILHFLFISSK